MSRATKPWACAWCHKVWPARKGAKSAMLAHQHDCDRICILCRGTGRLVGSAIGPEECPYCEVPTTLKVSS